MAWLAGILIALMVTFGGNSVAAIGGDFTLTADDGSL